MQSSSNKRKFVKKDFKYNTKKILKIFYFVVCPKLSKIVWMQ